MECLVGRGGYGSHFVKKVCQKLSLFRCRVSDVTWRPLAIKRTIKSQKVFFTLQIYLLLEFLIRTLQLPILYVPILIWKRYY